jgi:hypothetical protein
MFKKYLIIACFIAPGSFAWSQDTLPASGPVTIDDMAIDTSLDYDDLLNDLDLFLDSILAPRSFFQVNLSAAAGYFNYTTRNNYVVAVKKRLILSPMIGYYHKSGPGISVSANMIRGRTNYKLYQYSITPSFDLIQSKKWTGGISYTRHITKDSLNFYTTPLQNEIGLYYLRRKGWLQPGVTANYGWGSRTDVKERIEYLTKIILKERPILRNTAVGTVIDTIKVIDTIRTRLTTRESIVDFSLTATLRHTFYWLAIFSHNDCIKFTPMLAFSVGTQQFGFNQTYARTSSIRSAANVTFNRGDVQLDEKLKLRPLSLTLYLRPEYSIGKFYIQPQLMLDYYFPAGIDKFTTFFSVNAGFMF